MTRPEKSNYVNKYISLRGARQNNLKNINIDLPGNKFIVITGVSGSGKSTLALDTIFAEGQRRYMESLSVYARQFLERMDKPEIDSISGIPPAIAIEQTDPPRNSRSTVGTATEINDYLRLLFARTGKIYCPSCMRQVEKDTLEKVLEKIMSLKEGTRIFITFPYFMNNASSLQEHLTFLKSKGYIRIMTGKGPVKIDDFDTCRDLISQTTTNQIPQRKIMILLDRLKVSDEARGRLADSLEIAYREGKGKMEILIEDGEILKFTQNLYCSYCERDFLESSPLLFSFNSPFGACPRCHGFGNLIKFDHSLVIPDENKSLREGAVIPWTTPKGKKFFRKVERICSGYQIPVDIPYKDLTEWQKDIIWNGKGNFPGILGFFEMIEEKKYKLHVRVFLNKFRGYNLCPECMGKRLRPEALCVKIDNRDIAEISSLSAGKALKFFSSLQKGLNEYEYSISELILKEINKRLEYLCNVGLEYLTLDRLTKTLSAGEYQRINLAACLGSSLTGTLYVLDEPSIGLHARDNDRLIGIFKKLRDLKNTVLVVEHDPEIIISSDYVVDLGPGPGKLGGEVIFSGPPEELSLYTGKSLTADYLMGEKKIPVASEEREDLFNSFCPERTEKYIKLSGAKEHNLKNIDLRIPLNCMVCVTGVSGSGKSTLISDVFFPALKREKGDFSIPSGKYDTLEGADNIEDVIMVDQSPIGKTPRSNPVTYVKAFDYIRNIFSRLAEARVKGLKPGHFSFNVEGGRCKHCEGNGYIQVDMQFMADLYVLCQECQGKRYEKRILDINYKGKNIFDVLNMTVDEGSEFFSPYPVLLKKLKVLQDTGLGYLHLGQPANTLSGGEAQRLKLASHLLSGRGKASLYMFDEPTTGLHMADIEKLLHCLRSLIDKGNSVLIIEHNMEMIKNADYIIDLGPEGGDLGGEIIATGSPEEIMKEERSHTGKYLKSYLVNRKEIIY
ncbi:MAG: UvrABC system protein A [bacterium ADurb.Bin363]|nr:MAG: UvrABC system protein A [bacterium ADurb.Bin363]